MSKLLASLVLGLVCITASVGCLNAAEQADSGKLDPSGETGLAEVASPLLSGQMKGAYLTLEVLAIKPSAMLYPVRIRSINNYVIKPLVHGYQYHLKPGNYEIIAKPDFSLITDIKPFMNQPYEQQTFLLTLESGKSYLLGARVNPDIANEWQLELMQMGMAVDPAGTP